MARLDREPGGDAEIVLRLLDVAGTGHSVELHAGDMDAIHEGGLDPEAIREVPLEVHARDSRQPADERPLVGLVSEVEEAGVEIRVTDTQDQAEVVILLAHEPVP